MSGSRSVYFCWHTQLNFELYVYRDNLGIVAGETAAAHMACLWPVSGWGGRMTDGLSAYKAWLDSTAQMTLCTIRPPIFHPAISRPAARGVGFEWEPAGALRVLLLGTHDSVQWVRPATEESQTPSRSNFTALRFTVQTDWDPTWTERIQEECFHLKDGSIVFTRMEARLTLDRREVEVLHKHITVKIEDWYFTESSWCYL